MSTQVEEAQSAELDRLVKFAADLVNKGTISLSDVLGAIAETKEVEILPAPEVLPIPMEITQEQREALDKVTEVFGKVVPAKRRALEPVEVAQLVEEKETLDQLKKMAEARHQNIRTTIFNHLDVEAEEEQLVDETTLRDKDGHYILKGEVRGQKDTGMKFTRQVSNVSPKLDPEALKDLVDDPEVEFSHEDYLAVTSQVRVLDENKLMLALKKNPRLILAISKATIAGGKNISMFLRKA